MPVILCGGFGARVWPESRETLPKQFIPLVGRRSTFQMTIDGLAAPLFHRPIVVTHYDYRFLIAEQLNQIGAEAEIILEPTRRDSAAAAAVATEIAARLDPRAIVALLTADHVVRDKSRFVEMCGGAAEAAAQGYIVALGVQWDAGACGRSCLHVGAPIAPDSDIRFVDSFVDGSPRKVAEALATSGCLQSFGEFVFQCDTLEREIGRLEPAIATAAKAALLASKNDLGFVALDARSFERAPAMSLERALIGRSNRTAVLPCHFDGSDVRSWRAIVDQAERDANGNSLSGDAVVMNATNVYVRSSGALTAVVGLDDVIVVTTRDAVLVLNRNYDGAVKTLVERLKRENRREATEHKRIYRPWGHYELVDSGVRYQVKRIVVKPGARLSLQKHFHRAEHWIVVRGTAEVTRNEESHLVHENESIFVPVGSIHRLGNPGRIDLELIEVQTGSYLGEDDIVRLDDAYNRA